MIEIYKQKAATLMSVYSRYYKKDLGVTILHRVSGVLLLREYINRLICWERVLNDNTISLNNSLYLLDKRTHNLFNNFNGELWLDEMISIEDFNKIFIDSGIKLNRSNRYFDIEFLCWFTSWSIFEDQTSISKHNLLNPYEPAAIIIERGQSVRISEARICIDYLAFNNFYPDFKLPSLDFEFLDYVDTQFIFGKNDIPGQKDVDKLWLDFQNK